jgi:hypothetical protein
MSEIIIWLSFKANVNYYCLKIEKLVTPSWISPETDKANADVHLDMWITQISHPNVSNNNAFSAFFVAPEYEFGKFR